ncbi:MAG: Plug domain-containing protein, partial [Pseudomonadales bacterium]|nr:Plug domain-containing protein [Pseudomonadales bacterium]
MKTHFVRKALATAVLSAFTSGAYAQATIEEIVVVARKRAENLQEVPIAVSVFTEAEIQAAGIQRPADFISLIPNVTIVDTANVGDTQVSIRGIVSTRDAESTFAYVVDGVLVTNPNGFNEELLDVSQIEVLKGPQGALYGRNAVAGAILVTTNQPDNEVEVEVRVGAGNNNARTG